MSEVLYAAAVKPLTYRMPAKFRVGGWHVCSWALLLTGRPPQNRRCPAARPHRAAREDVPITIHRWRALVLEVGPPLQEIAPRRAPDGFDHAPALS